MAMPVGDTLPEGSGDVREEGHDEFQTPDKATAIAIADIEEHYDIDSDNSPLPEVRANVPNVDDPSMPVNTLRMWVIGVLFTIIGTGINQFFSMRYPSVTISSLVAQLLAFPVGRAVAHLLPVMKLRLFGREFCLNPDHHFNIKEHAVVTIMSNLSFGPSWATDIIQAQKASAFYGLETPAGYQFLLALTMQLFGSSLSRRMWSGRRRWLMRRCFRRFMGGRTPRPMGGRCRGIASSCMSLLVAGYG